MKQICPKCNGQKKVMMPPWVPGDAPSWNASTIESYECGICNGSGLIESTPNTISSDELAIGFAEWLALDKNKYRALCFVDKLGKWSMRYFELITTLELLKIYKQTLTPGDKQEEL